MSIDCLVYIYNNATSISDSATAGFVKRTTWTREGAYLMQPISHATFIARRALDSARYLISQIPEESGIFVDGDAFVSSFGVLGENGDRVRVQPTEYTPMSLRNPGARSRGRAEVAKYVERSRAGYAFRLKSVLQSVRRRKGKAKGNQQAMNTQRAKGKKGVSKANAKSGEKSGARDCADSGKVTQPAQSECIVLTL